MLVVCAVCHDPCESAIDAHDASRAQCCGGLPPARGEEGSPSRAGWGATQVTASAIGKFVCVYIQEFQCTAVAYFERPIHPVIQCLVHCQLPWSIRVGCTSQPMSPAMRGSSNR
eukprot:5109615-Prymnesium_polylepis.1